MQINITSLWSSLKGDTLDMVNLKKFFFLMSVLLLSIVSQPKQNREDFLKELFEKIQKFQENIKSIKVNFTQINDFKILKKPQVLKGKIFVKKPDKVLYLYEEPEKIYYLVKKGELLVYNPSKKEAYIQDVERYQVKIMKYIGTTTPFKELEKKFDSEICNEEDNKICILFHPKRKNLQKRISSLEFWILKNELLIEKIEVSETEGDKVKFIFDKWELNSDLKDNIFEIQIPKGIKIKRGYISPLLEAKE